MFRKLKPKRIFRQEIYVRPLLPALIIFFAFMTLIGLSWRTAVRDIKNQTSSSINENANFIENTLVQRFSIYEGTLRAANGLFRGSGSVTRTEWTDFITSLKLNERYPGIRSVGYIKVISKEEKEPFVSAVQLNDLPSYKIHPETDSETYAPLVYFVPTANQNLDDKNAPVIGYDMYSSPERKKAMLISAKSGNPTFTELFDLSSAVGGGPTAKGFLLYLPSYKHDSPTATSDQRLAALEGYFYAPFLADDVFKNVFQIKDPSFAFGIYDENTNPANMIFKSSEKFNDLNFKKIKTSEINLYGQKWIIEYKANSSIVPSTVRQRPFNLLIGGSIFSASLASIIYLLIQRRTRSLAYTEQKRLEDAKDELLSLASHQLRTPATAVKQYVSMLKDGFAGNLSSDQQALLTMAYESNERQLTIVDDLLYVARIDAGQTALRVENINIGKLVKSVVADQLLTIKSRKQTVKINMPKNAITADVDPQYMRMIIENLLSNASKYSHEKKKININLSQEKNHVKVDVIDQGVGIPAESFRNVFVRFNRIPNELSRQIAGSGIGLYLAKQLALLHGGDITFTSVQNQGSTFSLTFPINNKA